MDTYVDLPFKLRVEKYSVTMIYSCIGFGIMSFWTAFVLANNDPLNKKLLWLFGGLFAIWFINCWRVALLLIALLNHWQINKYADHHTLFNIAAYILIFVMIYFYSKNDKRKAAVA